MKFKKEKDLLYEFVSHNKEIPKKVFIKKGEVSTLTQFAKIFFKAGQTADAHIHQDMYEGFLVEKGSGEIIVDGKNSKVDEGSFVLVEPGEAHEVRAILDMTVVVFGIV